MIVKVLSVGKNRIEAIDLIREYSGSSLAVANSLIDQGEFEFKSYEPYEHIHNMMTEFQNAGCKIEIETGHRKPRKMRRFSFLKLIMLKAIKENSEKIKITSLEEAKSFLIKRQCFTKAILTALISCLSIVVLMSIYQYSGGDFVDPFINVWTTSLIIGLTVGFSVRRRGRGVETKFGITAAVFTVLTGILLQYSASAIMFYEEGRKISEIFGATEIFSKRLLVPLSVSATLSFFVGYERYDSVRLNETRADIMSGVDISEIIDKRKKGYKDSFTFVHRTYNTLLKQKSDVKAKG